MEEDVVLERYTTLLLNVRLISLLIAGAIAGALIALMFLIVAGVIVICWSGHAGVSAILIKKAFFPFLILFSAGGILCSLIYRRRAKEGKPIQEELIARLWRPWHELCLMAVGRVNQELIIEKEFFRFQCLREIIRSKRYNVPLSLVLGSTHVENISDLEKMFRKPDTNKIINKEIKKFLRRNIRKTDVVARVEDNRIAILLPYIPPENAVAAINRLRDLLATSFTISKKKVKVFFIFGMATYSSGIKDESEFMKKAEISLAEQTSKLA